MNLGMHVGDDEVNVSRNRALLPQWQNIAWLDQVHSNHVHIAQRADLKHLPIANCDALITQERNLVCAVMTADCLPILVSNQAGTEVAAIHAGWRGLADGIVQNTLARMTTPANQLSVWVGPHIGQKHFEVGSEVKRAFQHFPQAFKTSDSADKYHCSMLLILRELLLDLGVRQVYSLDQCTYSHSQRFFSHRRSAHQGSLPTGRMVCGIYLT